MDPVVGARSGQKIVRFGLWEKGVTITRPMPDGSTMLWRVGEREAEQFILGMQKSLAAYKAKTAPPGA